MKLGEVKEVSLVDIRLQGINVRSDLNSANSQEALEELAASIKENGLMQPIVLRGPEGTRPYDVVVGQRRFIAHQRLGLLTIKATFTEEISDTDALILSLSENLLRQDLSEKDIMRVVTLLYEQFDKDEQQVKKKLGLSIKAIRGYIKVKSKATPKILSMIDGGDISMIDARRAIDAAQGNSEKADAFAESISSMTKHEKVRAVLYGKANPDATIDQIIEEAQTPGVEENIILNLPYAISKALKVASNNLTKGSDEIVIDALTDWLVTNNFLNSQQL
jgi:ParB family transcriptional regulator, chromosome partitioning protein